jgi:hypothetical protein
VAAAPPAGPPDAAPGAGPGARRPGVWPLAAGAAVVAGALWLGARQDRAAGADAAAARAATAAFGPGAGVAALTVRTTDGRTTPLAALGAPAVVMVVSTGCGVCKEALADFGRLRAGRPLPRLWVVTLEGAGEGPAMTRAAGVAGAVHAGPLSPAAGALFTFQLAGTPTFLALDARGRVTRVLPGYPGRGAMAPWLRLMAGEADRL